MHYNTTLCKEALGKNYWHELRSVRVIAPITMTVIFLERWRGVAIEMLILFITIFKILVDK